MLAVVGGKGGCGKSTTALGLARALARQGCNPLVVDVDTDCPDVHLLAAVDRTPTYDVLEDGTAPECVCQRAPTLAGSGVLPAGRDATLTTALAAIADWQGPVLLDCPAGAGPDATTPLRFADRSVLATIDETESLEDTATTAGVATRLDAPPVATIVRSDRRRCSLPFASPLVERVPRIDIEQTDDRAIETVLSHPGVSMAHQRVADKLQRESTRRNVSRSSITNF